MTQSRLGLTGILLVLVVPACSQAPEGIARTEAGSGPEIVFDFFHRPLPEIPLPNDLATRADRSSPTGLRINASLVAPTALEATARARIDELSGWGTLQPISVAFDEPLDLDVILARHRDFRSTPDGSDYDFSNDAVFLIDVTPSSPTYLEPVPLDFGEGNFPVLLRTPNQYWEHDPKTITKALAFETYNEDHNRNGVMDPGEDLDLDGVLDRPNVYYKNDGDPSSLDPNRDLVSFYEMQTDTLLFKPILPLEEKTTYAVVLTKRLTGKDGEPVHSPFDYVNHTSQTDELWPAVEALNELGLDLDDIAFAWTFTTQDATGELVMLRDGLYGAGPLAWLAEDNPPELTHVFPLRDEIDWDGTVAENQFVLPAEKLIPLIEPFAEAVFGNLVGGGSTQQLEDAHEFFDYHFSGKFRSPRLLDLTEEGNLDARAWPADLRDSGLRDRIVYDELQFWCAVPKREYVDDPSRPAPVVLYAHGFTSNKLEQLGLALHAKFGIAACSIDGVGHGLVAGDQELALKELLGIHGIGIAFDAVVESRVHDVDGNGLEQADVGAEVFGAYMFRTRDSLRQTLLDYLAFVRMVRTFGTGEMQDVNGDGQPELLGDFNADGVADIGGEDAIFFASGTSFGGLISSMLSALEPGVVAAAPISGGAGLVDLTVRSEQGGVVEGVALRLFGQLFIGEPTGTGAMRIYQLLVNGRTAERYDVAFRTEVQPGDIVMATNLDTGRSRCARVMPEEAPPGYEEFLGWPQSANCALEDNGTHGCRTCDAQTVGRYGCDLAGTFRVGIAADDGDRIQLQVFEGSADDDVVTVSGDELHCQTTASAKLRTSIDTFETPVTYRTVTYPAGDELVALEDGFGFQRATPLLRRFTGLAQVVIQSADPVTFAPHYSRDPLVFREGDDEFQAPPTHVLNVTTIGDANVPVNTGIAIAKVAGFIELSQPDARYGKTPNRVLIDEGVQDGIPWIRTRGDEWGPVLVDVDNLSQSANTAPLDETGSLDGLRAPRLDPPLRLIAPTRGAEAEGLSGIVLPMLHEFNGAHGFPPPGMTGLDFDVGQYMEHQIGWFFHKRGAEVRYDACMAELAACDFIPELPP